MELFIVIPPHGYRMNADHHPLSKTERVFQAEVIRYTETFARELLNQFDLSEATARQLSFGTSKYIYHRLLSPKGTLKTGGAKKSGQLSLDRYISFRIRDEIVALSILRFSKGGKIVFEVAAPERCLKNPKPITEARPYLNPEKLGLYKHSEQFEDVKTATAAFERALLLLDSKIQKKPSGVST